MGKRNDDWTTQDSAELYGVPYWGRSLFQVTDDGHLAVLPHGPKRPAIDLKALVDDLTEGGVELPILLRVPEVARRRMALLVRIFDNAFHEHGYVGRYRGVYPIKVNQQRSLVEELLKYGKKHGFGLEAGSKPELLVALALLEHEDALLICNGYKDRQYIETAMRATKLGRDTVIVIERPSEVDIILEARERLGIQPRLGVRAKLSNQGKGRWKSSAGDRAKFGLSAADINELVERLREADALDCLQLLHFHIGSQVTSVRPFRSAVREAARLYVELVRLGAPMGTLDVGGGLGVDYDGSRTDFESSMNYTESEYAANIVAEIVGVCDAAGVEHPDLVTESGRATVAHSSVLLFEVVGTESRPTEGQPPPADPAEDPLITELRDAFELANARRYQEAWHDANELRDRARQAFQVGVMTLPVLAQVESIYWQICGKVMRIARKQSYVPDDLDGLAPALADTYYGNFSVFQSVPDAWAVDQLFPVLPIHRLDERPTRRAVIADLTCDSDGKLDRFVDRRDIKSVLELHAPRDGERYVLAIALVGAYQEILGDMHNLFGPTNAVHVSLGEDNEYSVDLVIEGAAVETTIGHVQYSRKDLVHRIQQATEAALRAKRLTRKEAAELMAHYRAGISSYTYLQR